MQTIIIYFDIGRLNSTLEKELFNQRLAICTPCELSVVLVIFQFWFLGRTFGLIVQVPDRCLLFTSNWTNVDNEAMTKFWS